MHLAFQEAGGVSQSDCIYIIASARGVMPVFFPASAEARCLGGESRLPFTAVSAKMIH